MKTKLVLALLFFHLVYATAVWAHPLPLHEVTVYGRQEDLIGIANSAAQGFVGAEQIEDRPLLRPTEVLETVPGLILSQHSGFGKANQYFLRGFNLDHGTDFSSFIEGMPVNLPTHAHGQGYTDFNFLIPELIRSIEYKKGPYYAEVGDFSAAGSTNVSYVDSLDHGLVSYTLGEDSYNRLLLANGAECADSRFVYAVEGLYNDGPWDDPENGKKLNSVFKWSYGDKASGFNLLGLVYSSDWDSTDQIPARAVELGEISRFGTIDDSDGGRTSRFSLVANGWNNSEYGTTKVNLYSYYYRLNLFSNFTYFLDDPINGDQFEQADRRYGVGGDVHHTVPVSFSESNEGAVTIGAQIRNDSIPEVRLSKTKDRKLLSDVRNDDVNEASAALYASGDLALLSWLRSVVGVRADRYWFDVESSISENSGNESEAIWSPKAALILGPWAQTELFLNYGRGFHSNDARGTTIHVDPTDPSQSAEPVDPLVKSEGAEFGIRSNVVDGLNSTLSLWALDLDSELLFIGDAGTTEASRPSRRYGLELANYYTLTDWLTVDADWSASQARFRDPAPEGREIPGSIETVVASGLLVQFSEQVFSELRLRYFGPRPLTEDDSQRSDETALFNLVLGYNIGDVAMFKNLRLTAAVLNLFDEDASDIDYYYESRLAGEPDEGVADRHFHPAEPRTTRFTLSFNF